MARKKKCPEHVDHERWLVSYADFITLLFAFFVVMYATASVNQGKYKILSDSLYGAFSGEPRVPEPIQVGIVSKSPNLNTNITRKIKERMRKKIEIQKFTNVSELVGGKTTEEEKKKEQARTKQSKQKKELKSKAKSQSPTKQKVKKRSISQAPSKVESKKKKESKAQQQKNQKEGNKTKEKVVMGKLMAKISQKLKKQFSNLINKERIKIRHNNKFVSVELNNNFFYKKGSHHFNKDAIPVIGRIVDILEKYPNFPIIVEGHSSDERADKSEKFTDWQLSGLRSSSLIHVLTDFNISPSRLTSSAFASYKPAYPQNTKRGRQQNRRTVILIKADPQNTDFLRLLRKIPNIDYGKIYAFVE